MGKKTDLRNVRKENSSGIPAHWIYGSINPVHKLLSAIHIALNTCKSVELELLHYQTSWIHIHC